MICILLSTYNGEKYLSTLLDSLIAQDYPDIMILIRDDGSTDGTREIVNTYAEEYDHIEVLLEPNIGVNNSFFQLLARANDLEAQYVAFCDQDDCWEKDKISRAIRSLSNEHVGGAAMYCSRLIIADEDLNVISHSFLSQHGPSFKNALVENIATGATIVVNRDAVNLLTVNMPDLDELKMYDWWIYQVISALGTVMYDTESRILSRQHATNVAGLAFGWRRWKSKYQFLRSPNRYEVTTQARELARVIRNQLSDEHLQIIDEFIAGVGDPKLLNRASYAFRKKVFRQRGSDDLLLRLRIILGKL